MAICSKKVMPGALVMVSFPVEKEQTKNPARKFEGQEFTVERVREISYGTSGALRGTEYYLEGAVSPYGVPYAFLEEHLVKI